MITLPFGSGIIKNLTNFNCLKYLRPMNVFFKFLYLSLPALHILAGMSMLMKMILVFRYKSISLPVYIISFFRVYSRTERETRNNVVWKRFMVMNNMINFYLYFWAFITIIIFLVFHTVY